MTQAESKPKASARAAKSATSDSGSGRPAARSTVGSGDAELHRPALVPVGVDLVGRADAQHLVLLQGAAGDLQADRQPVGVEAAGHGQGRQAGQVERAGQAGVVVDHRQRLLARQRDLVLPGADRADRARRGDDGVEPVALERLPQPPADERSQPLGVEVRPGRDELAGGQEVLDALAVEVALLTVVRVVARALDHAHDHGDRERELDVLDLDRHELGAEALEHLQRVAHRALHRRLDPLEEEPLGHAEPLPGHVGGQAGDVDPGQDLERPPAVRGGSGDRPDVIARPGARHDPVSAHPAVRRLEAGHAVERGRVADRRAGVAPETQETLARRHRGRRAAARAAGDPGRVPGVAGRRGLRAERELVGHGLAEDHGAAAPERRDDVGVPGRDLPAPGRRAGLGGEAGDVHQVLHADRDPAQEPALAAAPGGVGLARRGQRPVAVDHHEGLQRRLDRLDPVEQRLGQLDRRDLGGVQQPAGLLERQLVQRRHRSGQRSTVSDTVGSTSRRSARSTEARSASAR